MRSARAAVLKAGAWAAAWTALGGLFWTAAGCAVSESPGGPGPHTAQTAARSVADILVRDHGAKRVDWPRSPDAVLRTWADAECVVLTADDRAPHGGAALDEPTLQACRDYVAQGGRLLLFGFAVSFVHALGVESVRPDRVGLVSWGDDARTAIGLMQFGVALTAGDEALALASDMRAFPRHPDAFLFGGGANGVIAQRCTWSVAPPADGEVLGRTAQLLDTKFRIDGADAALVRWRYGAGGVVGCGWLPEPDRPEPAIANNARLALRNLLELARRTRSGGAKQAGAGGGVNAEAVVQRSGLVVATIPSPRAVDQLDSAASALEAERAGRVLDLETRFPGALLLPHIGWRVPVAQRGADAAIRIAPRSVYDGVVEPSFRAGASLIELALMDPEVGYPFEWPATAREGSAAEAVAVSAQAQQRPAALRGGERSLWPGWSPGQVAILAREAHYRGLLMQLDLDSVALPSTASSLDGGRIAVVRTLASELADQRRLGDAAVDGFNFGQVAPDPFGSLVAAMSSYAPGVYGLTGAPRTVPVTGFHGVIDRDRGRPAGLPTAGLSDRWRPLFAPSSFPHGLLDARAVGPGSYADWMVTQVCDFTRARRGRGAGLWWGDYVPEQLGPRGADYVHGLSLDPMRAAVAFRLSSTGRDGFRAACRALLPRMQSGFGAESPLPASTAVLQNGHFRLHGTGGPLWHDPEGLARFHQDETRRVDIAPQSFMTTSVRGARPRVTGLRAVAIDFMGAAPRGAGGYASGCVVDLRKAAVSESAADPAGSAADAKTSAFPARLLRAGQPTWPESCSLRFDAPAGRYRLDLELRPRAGAGVLALRVEGALQTFIPCAAVEDSGGGEGLGAGLRQIELSFADAGSVPRRLDLELVSGDLELGFALCSLRRIDETASVGRVAARDVAGYVAELHERTVSPYFEEDVVVRTVAGTAGFVLQMRCERAVRNLQVLRAFGLPQHRLLRAASELRDRMTTSFVLSAAKEGVPDLVVVPLNLPFGARLSLDAERGLELHSFPRVGQECSLGFFFTEAGTVGPRELAAFGAGCASMLRPAEVDLRRQPVSTDGGFTAVTLPADPKCLELMPRLVQVRSARGGPFMVREAGAWMFRGGQARTAIGEVAAGANAAESAAAGQLDWLRVYEAKDQPAAIAAWDPERLPFRPGPGSLHSIALRELDTEGEAAAALSATGLTLFEAGVDVEVLQTGPLLAAPSVVFRDAFDHVRVDGEDWSYIDGRRVCLPQRPGRYRVTVRRLDRAVQPRVRATRALVRRCSYDPTSKVLEVVTSRRPEDALDTAYVAWIDSPAEPLEVIGGLRTPEDRFAATPEGAPRRGFVVRFKPGLLRVRF